MTLYLGAAMAVTVVITAFYCRHRVAHRETISYDVLFVSAAVANIIVFFAWAFYEEGWHLFSRDALGSGGKGSLGEAFVVMGVITAICFLPALAVAVFYQRRARKVGLES